MSSPNYSARVTQVERSCIHLVVDTHGYGFEITPLFAFRALRELAEDLDDADALRAFDLDDIMAADEDAVAMSNEVVAEVEASDLKNALLASHDGRVVRTGARNGRAPAELTYRITVTDPKWLRGFDDTVHGDLYAYEHRSTEEIDRLGRFVDATAAAPRVALTAAGSAIEVAFRDEGATPSKSSHLVALAISAVGPRALTADDESVRLWDVATKKSLRLSDASAQQLGFSLDGSRAFSLAAGVLRTFDAESGALVCERSCGDGAVVASFAVDARRAVTVDDRGVLTSWDLDTLAPEPFASRASAVADEDCVALDEARDRIVTLDVTSAPARARVWSLRSRALEREIELRLEAPCAVSFVGARIVVEDRVGGILVCDATGEPRHRIQLPERPRRGLVEVDAQHVGAITTNELTIIDAETGRITMRAELPTTYWTRPIAGTRKAALFGEDCVTILDCRHMTISTRVRLDAQLCQFAPTGRWAVLASPQTPGRPIVFEVRA